MKQSSAPLDSKADPASKALKERSYAAELGAYFIGATLLLIGFLALWSKAFLDGGLWWLFAAVAFVLGLVVGERLKRRIEPLIRLSRELRNDDKSA